MRISSRDDIYSTTSSTATGYIGFRCCVGVINNPGYLLPNGNAETVAPVSIITSDISTFVNSHNVKMVFVNKSAEKGYLCMVDFSELYPKINQYFDISDVYMPVVSPDGK